MEQEVFKDIVENLRELRRYEYLFKTGTKPINYKNSIEKVVRIMRKLVADYKMLSNQYLINELRVLGEPAIAVMLEEAEKGETLAVSVAAAFRQIQKKLPSARVNAISFRWFKIRNCS